MINGMIFLTGHIIGGHYSYPIYCHFYTNGL